MAGWFDSIYNKAADFVNEYAADTFNTVRTAVNIVKHGARAVVTAVGDGVGKLGNCAKTTVSWLEPIATPLKVLSLGDGLWDLAHGKNKKIWEFACSWGLGAAAALGTAAAIAAAPVTVPAAAVAGTVFVVGSAGAIAGDWIGGKIGEAIDDFNEEYKTPVPTPDPQKSLPVNLHDISKQKINSPTTAPEVQTTSAEEIRQAIPVIPLEFRKALDKNAPMPEIPSSPATSVGTRNSGAALSY